MVNIFCASRPQGMINKTTLITSNIRTSKIVSEILIPSSTKIFVSKELYVISTVVDNIERWLLSVWEVPYKRVEEFQ